MQLLRTIAIIVLIYYGFKLLAKYVFPIFLKRWVNKKMGQFQGQGQSQFTNEQKEKEYVKNHEGEVKIKSTGSKHHTETQGMGDDVDFEEVD